MTATPQGRGELRDQPPPARSRPTTRPGNPLGALPKPSAAARGELRDQPPLARSRLAT
ncbi:hypothetical protein [Streptomyces sp. NPDC058307]|uniref:hypothetical protein n=1 Tax=Streptomyces sp. NPDC058307 TaxID=3346439 RepID=UPI0036EBE41C